MTITEIARAYMEISQNDTDHNREILDLIQEKEIFDKVFDVLSKSSYDHGNGD